MYLYGWMTYVANFLLTHKTSTDKLNSIKGYNMLFRVL